MSEVWIEIRKNAKQFVQKWEYTTGEEERYDRKFMMDFFSVFGVPDDKYSFQEPIKTIGTKTKKKTETTKKIDGLYKGKLLIEMKSLRLGKKCLNDAYLQACDYYDGIYKQSFGDVPKFILVSNFGFFRLYNMENGKEFPPVEFSISEFENYVKYFSFLVDEDKYPLHGEEKNLDYEASELMAEIHQGLKALGYNGEKLQLYLVRLLFCMFAEDSGIFEPDAFLNYINSSSSDGSDLGDKLNHLFGILNRNEDDRKARQRDAGLYKKFAYINGGLFAENLDVPDFDKKTRDLLKKCCNFNWNQIKPEIFGSLFQNVIDIEDKELRRQLGEHFTNEENILKVINPLFIDSLWEEFEECKSAIGKINIYGKEKSRKEFELEKFQDKLASLKFMDPACGCGNFLIVTYRELRRLEIAVLKELYPLLSMTNQTVLQLDNLCKVNVNQFYGIELNEFPVQVARVGMWLCDHLMNIDAASTFGGNQIRLPLKAAAHIHHGNALRMDWDSEVVSNKEINYIIGNPPFVGHQNRTDEQIDDLKLIFGGTTKLDYVCGWYIKSLDYMKGTNIRAAFVSTNSIVQGESVSIMQDYFTSKNMVINYAYKTFIWKNAAKGEAHVHCVIIGFSSGELGCKKYIFDEKLNPTLVNNINSRLEAKDEIFIENRCGPLNPGQPEMTKGNQPTDFHDKEFHGLMVSTEEKEYFISKYPQSEKWIKPYLGGKDLLHNQKRYCFWFEGVAPSEFSNIPEINDRLDKITELRKLSKTRCVRDVDSKTPWLFSQRGRLPKTTYLGVAQTSSELRDYIIFTFVDPNIIPSNGLFYIESTSMYVFGLISSKIHALWVNAVCGRMKSDYRYSPAIYHNFPFPNVTEKQREEIEQAAQGVIDARALYPNDSLHTLYIGGRMPVELMNAHAKLDKAVLKAYGLKPNATGDDMYRVLKQMHEKLLANAKLIDNRRK